MYKRVTFKDITDFLGMPPSAINDIKSVTMYGEDGYVEVAMFVRDNAGKKIMNHRGETIEHRLQIAVVG